MGWIVPNGQQQALHYKNHDKGYAKPNPRALDPDAKAKADQQVPLDDPVSPEEAEQWDRAYLAAIAEKKARGCDDENVDSVIKGCKSPTVAHTDTTAKREPCNAAYWKELIQKISGKKVAKTKGTLQFYYIRDGMNGMDTPFLKNYGIGSSANQNNVTWDASGLQFQSDINDALVIFDSDGGLVDVYRLSVPLVSDVGDATDPDIVKPTLTPDVVNTWDGAAMYAYRNHHYEYTAIYPDDPYKNKKPGYWVDIHGSKYTFGCIEVIENLKKDASGNCTGMRDTTKRPDSEIEDLPDKNWIPAIPKGQSRVVLGTIWVIPKSK